MPESEHHAEFEPEAMQSIIEALYMTFRVLRLSDSRPDLGVLATRKIIELAKAGEREAERLKAASKMATDL